MLKQNVCDGLSALKCKTGSRTYWTLSLVKQIFYVAKHKKVHKFQMSSVISIIGGSGSWRTTSWQARGFLWGSGKGRNSRWKQVWNMTSLQPSQDWLLVWAQLLPGWGREGLWWVPLPSLLNSLFLREAPIWLQLLPLSNLLGMLLIVFIDWPCRNGNIS